jgi:hypothetical protein
MHYIQQINMKYFAALRDSAMRNLPAACLTFGASKELAEAVCNLPLEELERVASSKQLLLKPDIDVATLMRMAKAEDGDAVDFLCILKNAGAKND